MNFPIKTHQKRQLAAVAFFLMLALPLFAQENADSLYTFRFLFGKDMFFAPGMNNGAELDRLYNSVEQYKDLIMDHKVLLKVDGYCVSKGSDAERLAMARIRSNRVKSELIVRKGLTEDCFRTRNHPEEGDFVTIYFINADDGSSLPIPAPEIPEATEAEGVVETVEEVVEETPQAVEEVAPDNLIEQDTQVPVATSPAPREKVDSPFALKTNLLDYAILMPNIEAEWMFKDRWSVALEWQGAWWSKSSPRKVYRVSTVIPEVRYWVINRDRWHGMYVGAFVGAGKYDLSNASKGHEGEGAFGGLSVGYMWPISKHLSLDAGLGLGYMRIRDKKYLPEDGHYLYQFTKNINYFGPLRAKLSLVWRIPM